MTKAASSIVIAAPIRPTASSGNDVTSSRWAAHFRQLGYKVTVMAIDESAKEVSANDAQCLGRADVLVALHARRSARVTTWWNTHHADRLMVVALTGTDLYQDMPDNAEAMTAVETADQLIVLQQAASQRLEEQRHGWAAKTTVVHQSVPGPRLERQSIAGEFRVVVLAHLREVKDPLLAARAARRLDSSSRVRVHHCGRAFDDDWTEAALTEQANNPRYRWHRELDRDAAMKLLSTGQVLACTSLTEGGANVVTEAIALGVPVIGTHIDGNTGLLGDDYPGLSAVGDEEALADLLRRLENDSSLLAELQRRTDELKPIVDPATERAALASVLAAM